MLVRYPTPLRLLPLSLALGCPLAAADDTGVTLAPLNVTGQQTDSGYQASTASVGSFGETPLLDTPAAITVINQQLLKDQQARLLSEVLRNDASVGNAYAPVGYYENFNVRGFSLNASSSYRINGRTVAGEQNVALENKERVEVLKGLAGVQSGVADPGGLINYVTKRPADVRSVTVSTDEQGGRYLATDVGGLFGSQQQFGVRANLAHEDIKSYVNHADGQRDFASLALDWNISDNALLQLDAEYQNKQQRSVPGYQLLGGTELPHDASPRKHLGYQSWAKPVGIDSLNLNGSFQYRFNDAWSGKLSASHSKVVIDDYSSFAWGCYGAASCADSAVPNYFSPEGDYDIYDFRSPDDTRRNDEAEASLTGHFATGPLQHELTFGSGVMRRTLDSRPEINEYVGSGNIHERPVTFPEYEGALASSHRNLDSRQYSLFATDRIQFNEQWQTVIGGRQVRLDEHAYDSEGDATRHTQRSIFLPQVALIYKPRADVTLYTSYSKGLSLGGEAAWFTTNWGETLAPTISRQLEAGVKYDWQRMSFSAALFQTRQAYQYSKPNGDGSFTYVQQGQQKNTGLELAANGWATSQLQVSASVAAIRARVEGSGTAAYDGHQALNVPKLKASLYGDYSLPMFNGVGILGGVQYSGSKAANRAGTVKAEQYAVFNMGGRYSTRIEGYDTVFRLAVDNLFDKRYWSDVGDYLGDGYVFQGAPRTARLSATVNF